MSQNSNAASNRKTIEERMDELESRAAIQTLLADYCHGVDKRDLDRFLGVWHDDSVMSMGEPLGDFRGIDEIRRMATEIVWDVIFKECYHWTTNLSLVFPDPDHAHGLSDVSAVGVTPDGARLSIAASYRDVFERRAGNWRILHRSATIHYQLPISDSGGM